MFSHIVVFWTNPEIPNAADLVAEGAEKLRAIPGTTFFHVGKMVSSPRPVVDSSYQVAVNIVFENKDAHDTYQTHPLHIEFLEKTFKPNCIKVQIYDFE